MTIVGQLHVINPEREITTTFSKKEIIVKTIEQYPNHYPIEFTNDKINLLDGFVVGDLVTINANVRGNLSKAEGQEDRAYLSLVGWKITKQ